MKTLPEIEIQLTKGQFEFTRHALKRAIERNISEAEIREAGEQLTSIGSGGKHVQVPSVWCD